MRLLLLGLCLLLSSCTYLSSHSVFQNRNKHYLTETSIPPLRIPPGISSDQFENYYPVSDRYYPTVVKDVSLQPPGL